LNWLLNWLLNGLSLLIANGSGDVVNDSFEECSLLDRTVIVNVNVIVVVVVVVVIEVNLFCHGWYDLIL
jgi:hypothetical protein